MANLKSDFPVDSVSDTDIIDLHAQMLRFACLQLRDTHLAEDAVQEAMIAALQARHRFHAQSSLRTWVFAILKNKIANQLRQSPPWIRLSEMQGQTGEEDGDDQALLEQLFNQNIHWQPVQRPAVGIVRMLSLRIIISGEYSKSVWQICRKRRGGCS